jgi:hypothetical protein
MRLVKALLLSLLLFLLLFKQSNSQLPVYSDQDCLSCHGKPEIAQIMPDGKVRSLFVDPEEWSGDIHHRGKLICNDCHKNANPYLHFREGFIDVDCARCHPEEDEEYQKNIHHTFSGPITPGKELPLCFHCHTKHHVLRHDEPSSSVHESNLAETCGTCHPEVMMKGLVEGTSWGKISGHRKGDLSEKFDMRVCINCHYEDSAHGAKRVYKDFCIRCHDIKSKGNLVMGPTHLNLARWVRLNLIGNGLFVLFLLLGGSFIIYQSRKGISTKIRLWFNQMKKEEDSAEQDIAQVEKSNDPEDQKSNESGNKPNDNGN